MIQIQITTENARSACPLGSSKNDGQLKMLYETAFPTEEQIPWDDLVRLIGEMCDNKEQRLRRHAFYLRNGFRDTNVYRCWDDLEMTMMMMGPGTFTLQDWDEIIGELRKYWTWDLNYKCTVAPRRISKVLAFTSS